MAIKQLGRDITGYDILYTGGFLSRSAKENPIKCFTNTGRLTIRDSGQACLVGDCSCRAGAGGVVSLIVSRWRAGVETGLRLGCSELAFREVDLRFGPARDESNGPGTRKLLSAGRSQRSRMDREAVVSSVIGEVGYNASCRTLEILFSTGAIYLYYFVPAEVHRGLMSAASHGTYFNKEIKGIYEHHRIAEPYDKPRPRARKAGAGRSRSRKPR
jgi:KTSC domain